jgi:signal transduction histidine kinase/CheY-like chemotaxis protein
VRENLLKNADNLLSFTHEQIESELIASKMMLGSFSQTVRQMILDNNSDDLQHYINVISSYVISGESGLKNINGLYGYFEITGKDEIFLYYENLVWEQPEDLSITELPWYKAAIANCGVIMETQPYMDYFTGEYIITYSRCMHDYDDKRIGVACIDVPLNKIGGIAVNAALIEGGYGSLASQDLTMFAHANPAYVGRRMDDPGLHISQFADDFLQGRNIYERSMKNWKGEEVIVFTRVLPNGWHLILLTPKKLYYHSTDEMLIILCILGAIFAAALIIVLVRIESAKEKAGEKNKQKSAFLETMSHEIRTPMNAIIGMTYIGKSANDVPRKDYCLERIENSSQHLLTVINDVLDMSKIEANMFELSNDEFDFEKMLQRAISIVRMCAEEKKQTITVNIDKSIPRSLIGDDQRLAQVIVNLFGNAVKFTQEGGAIKLDARFVKEEDDIHTIQVTVSDNGIGISGEQQKQLFRTFQQADSKVARKYGGTGLGLVLSRYIVELMGGKIQLESEPGKGSSFSFTFKAIRGSRKNADLDEKTDYSGIFSGYRILLAEDVVINREIIEVLVEPTLLEMDCVSDGAEAVAMFAKSPDRYDLILMDVQMPKMDGYKATRKIREFEDDLKTHASETHKHPHGIPVIAMTANIFREDIERCKEAGMNDHLGKPLDVEEFYAMMRKYLPKK